MTHTEKLMPERATIQKIINEHYDPNDRGGRTRWSRAFKQDPALKKRLLFGGDGNEREQYTRLTQVVQRWVKNGLLTLPNGAPPATGNGDGVVKTKFRFDDHAPLLREIAAQYTSPAGRIEWKRAFKEHPEWLQQMGVESVTPGFIGRLQYWATRHLQGDAARETWSDSGLNFCPRCACNLKAVAVALNLAERT